MRDGVSDMHCMRDAYFAEELMLEHRERKKIKIQSKENVHEDDFSKR